jgi:hypothetical protein
MIRTTIALAVFAFMVCGLIVFIPFAGGDDLTSTDQLGPPANATIEVTRAATSNNDALAQPTAAVLDPTLACASVV